jgi:hypothetical protein
MGVSGQHHAPAVTDIVKRIILTHVKIDSHKAEDCRLDSYSSRQGPAVGSREHGYEPRVFGCLIRGISSKTTSRLFLNFIGT